MNNKKSALIFICILVVIICAGIIISKQIFKETRKATELKQTSEITVVPTMSDEITEDSSWCGSFELVWNDMKDTIVKKDIVFTPQEKMAINLNKEEFTKDMISEEYYYIKCGLQTYNLKEEIEKGIKEKFKEESDILDDFEWYDITDEYFFYAMLYRKFEFLKEFDKLENGQFGEKYDNIEYFGIDSTTKDLVGDQIDVLYYNSKDDFAISINTKSNDEIIFCKCPQGSTFKAIYEDINNQADNYTGSKNFEDTDEFKAPKLSINLKRRYTELENKPFSTVTGIARINSAIQTIKFTIDEKGGEIKSESGISATLGAVRKEEKSKDKPRYFYVDDTFVMFLREKNKNIPYFAARVKDITKFK